MASKSLKPFLTGADVVDDGGEGLLVTATDQDSICRFSCLNHRTEELEAENNDYAEKLQGIRDALEEVILGGMEDEEVNRSGGAFFVKFGEAFFSLPESAAEDFLKACEHAEASKHKSLAEKLTAIKEEVSVLKKELYLKFGDQVQLER